MGPNGIPLDTAAIVSTTLEGVLYGVSLFLFAVTLWVLLWRDNTVRGLVVKVSVAIALFLLSTAHMTLSVVRVIEGLVIYRDTYPGGPAAFFADVSQWTFAFKSLLWTLQTLIGDGVVIFRCYVAWDSWKAVALPIVMWFGLAVVGGMGTYITSYADENKHNIFAQENGVLATTFLVLSLMTNLSSTSLLIYRLWSIAREVARSTRQHEALEHASTSHLYTYNSVMAPLVRIFADSGLLYSATLISQLVTFVANNRGNYIILDMIMPIISITFFMVIIRVEMCSRDIRLAFMSASGTEMPTFVRPRDGRSYEEYMVEHVSLDQPPYPMKSAQRVRTIDSVVRI
ncbi:hypothetical protein CONPUDRAFT_163727 [Coniophora puteana RWD-64-598 SS2]|uniref:Uncharacterized protein n=1 Tax=Coniophora puteana (strain RWD-64-598) TaxID=741705 RepID=A0A5M3MU71_CONPW|nr:uncharacterized protein CONPUDRAFT_163727 [Coniophora puteana RWD-64-598 SS2]EIW82600.1 hypothetical protein CONPUDRAFT_163727 [Coniophora puteana RWD-64-598 SS2]